VQESVIFAPTCHTSKTRDLKKFEMCFWGIFSASANGIGRLVARRLIERILNAAPLDFALDY